jgi:two-component system, LuxR family, sensor kinase FixL
MSFAELVQWNLDRKRFALHLAAALTAFVMVVDSLVIRNASVGFLYFLPLAIAAPHFGYRANLLFASLCAVAAEFFSPFSFDRDALSRMAFRLAGFGSAALLVHAYARSLLNERDLVLALREHVRIRNESESQFHSLVETSPAAILKLDQDGRVVLANNSAQLLFECERGDLLGSPVERFLPQLARVPRSMANGAFRSTLRCDAHRQNGETFPAEIWFSTYMQNGSVCLAAIIFDLTENVREQEERMLQRMLHTSRVLIGSVNHEVRNLCIAVASVRESLGKVPAIRAAPEFELLGALLERLTTMTGGGFTAGMPPETGVVWVPELVEKLKMIANDESVVWENAAPASVRGDRGGLLQVCLNLIENARRAVAGAEHGVIRVSTELQEGTVSMRFWNNGLPVAAPERLFQPFHPGASGTGLGLFISRALVRSYGGDLRYEPCGGGCCFSVHLERVPSSEEPL